MHISFLKKVTCSLAEESKKFQKELLKLHYYVGAKSNEILSVITVAVRCLFIVRGQSLNHSEVDILGRAWNKVIVLSQ